MRLWEYGTVGNQAMQARARTDQDDPTPIREDTTQPRAGQQRACSGIRCQVLGRDGRPVGKKWDDTKTEGGIKTSER